ncbi:Mitotic spindle assembly checkpoint protein MAD2B [Leucoagaricus sp. SymC.cos]|nr:Mitotic spindle assembly checkpoint protein MAD2B [Leucoagaricus sp. SymC.cos]
MGTLFLYTLVEVAIHTILYVRQVYPPEIFIRRKKYETPVYQSRHPALNEYISGAVRAVRDELELAIPLSFLHVQGTVQRIVVVIKDKNNIALERFIFSVEHMIQVESFDKDTSVENAMTPGGLAQYFRSFLIKISMIESVLGQLELEDDISFGVIIELKDEAVPTVSHTKDPPPWVPAEHQNTTAGISDDAEMHMIRAVNTGIINLSVAVQESGEKLKRMKELLAP